MTDNAITQNAERLAALGRRMAEEQAEITMSGNKLPADICRCHDHKCPEKVGCLRYEQRDTGRVHAMGSLRTEYGCFERITTALLTTPED